MSPSFAYRPGLTVGSCPDYPPDFSKLSSTGVLGQDGPPDLSADNVGQPVRAANPGLTVGSYQGCPPRFSAGCPRPATLHNISSPRSSRHWPLSPMPLPALTASLPAKELSPRFRQLVCLAREFSSRSVALAAVGDDQRPLPQFHRCQGAGTLPQLRFHRCSIGLVEPGSCSPRS